MGQDQSIFKVIFAHLK